MNIFCFLHFQTHIRKPLNPKHRNPNGETHTRKPLNPKHRNPNGETHTRKPPNPKRRNPNGETQTQTSVSAKTPNGETQTHGRAICGSSELHRIRLLPSPSALARLTVKG
ncbi:uncharacterized protein LOC133800115 isoform X2 [Humulus lupulus]|uniref:uncharacterized protein LOC133800115 isoform X2 n=1 Tax=Humulus lupulus TaxID=3486 RepID=UPI002B40E944|nr:uncharacterized protein LOC133800115 isoform X2 [Humulus lupulus]